MKSAARTDTGSQAPPRESRRLPPIASVPLDTTTFIQRKAGCACGGCCPSCVEDGRIQPKLEVGAVNDHYEREADRVADQVMAMTSPSEAGLTISAVKEPRVARQADEAEPPALENEEDATGAAYQKRITTPWTPGPGGRAGAPLPDRLRNYYEPRFGQDFSTVRIHTDGEAQRSAAQLHARAYTAGENIVFGAGEYAPDYRSGQHLLGHELTHVVQQRRQRRPWIQRLTREEEIEQSRTSNGQVLATHPPLKISLYNYAIGEDDPKPTHLQLLDELAGIPDASGIFWFHVTGHTDSTDDAAFNDRLSHQRVDALRAALGERGINDVTAAWYGEQRAVASNDTVQGRSRNRRVDIYVTSSNTQGGDTGGQEPDAGTGGGGGGATDETLCGEYPLLCGALLFGGAAAGGLIACIISGTCLPPIPPIPPPGGGGPGGGDGGDTDPDDEQDREQLECGDPRMPHTQVQFPSGTDKGTWIHAEPLTRCPPLNGVRGSPAKNWDSNWPYGWECIPEGEGRLWRRAHLLHGPAASGETEHLHGPGDERWNIIITDGSINTLMANRVERKGVDAVDRVHGQHEVLSYSVQVEHFTGEYPRPYFGEKVHMQVDKINPLTNARTSLYDDTIESNKQRQPPQCPDEEEPGAGAEAVIETEPARPQATISAAEGPSEPMQLDPHDEFVHVSYGTHQYLEEAARESPIGRQIWRNEDVAREAIEREMEHVRVIYADEIRNQTLLAQIQSMGSGHAGVQRTLAMQRAIEILARYRVFRHLAISESMYRHPSIDAMVWGDFAR
ncbi:MAG: DUF4157 domain-containing protein [Pseudomonadota bacterium]|nr:DUF4157 domain-containing protein [Pseudomonadota bacterium]